MKTLRITALLVASHALVAAGVWALQESRQEALREALRSLETVDPLFAPGSALVGRIAKRPTCERVAYTGPETRLYADRPYHTTGPVAALEGTVFCRGKRHGRSFWLLEVSRETTLYALAGAAFELERDGWRRLEEPASVPAAGLAFDALYARRVTPGRYAIHYGQSATATPVFFDPDAARIAPLAAGGG